MSYTAGDTIPTGPVVGGYLARDGGIDFYVIRGRARGVDIFGYYNPVNALGYVALGGANSFTSMEMLVLI